MPVTPYHFGPALVAKALLNNRFCLTSFAVSQIVIDLESFYHLIHGNYPVHRFFHTYAGSIAAMLISIALSMPILKILKKKPSWLAITGASIFGGISHVFLDSIMHRDIRPLFPVSDSNHLLHIIPIQTLHDFCVFSGIFGLSILTWQFYQKAKI